VLDVVAVGSGGVGERDVVATEGKVYQKREDWGGNDSEEVWDAVGAGIDVLPRKLMFSTLTWKSKGCLSFR